MMLGESSEMPKSKLTVVPIEREERVPHEREASEQSLPWALLK
jgi:hypothetical protein